MFQSLALLFIFFIPLSAFAVPYEVLIFPDGAIVSESSGVTVKDGQATLILPQAADISSLSLSLEDGSLGKMTHYDFKQVEENPAVFETLKAKIKQRQTEHQQVVDQLAALESTLAYWQEQSKQRLEEVDAIVRLSQLIHEKNQDLHHQASTLRREKIELEQQIKALEDDLNRRTGQASKVWAVTIFFDHLPHNESLKTNYSYRIRNASWRPLYRLDARPVENRVDWSWRGEIVQSSGVDWDNVRVRLATKEPRTTLTPPTLTEWIIREQPQFQGRSLQKTARTKNFVAANMVDEVMAAPETEKVQREEGFLFDIYDLGKHQILAGQRYHLDIDNGRWPADFNYLSRPLFATEVFLMAEITLDDFTPLPSGPASLFVDSVLIGKRAFNLQSKTVDLAFGNDPAITCKVSREEVADKSGVFNKKQHKEWLWTVTLTNNKNHSVDLNVEDALPQVQHKDITIQPLHQVEKKGKKQEMSWKLTLAAGETKTLQFGYALEYPEEMKVQLGR